MNASTTPFPW